MCSMHTFREHSTLERLAAGCQDCAVAVETCTVLCDQPDIAKLRLVEQRADASQVSWLVLSQVFEQDLRTKGAPAVKAASKGLRQTHEPLAKVETINVRSPYCSVRVLQVDPVTGGSCLSMLPEVAADLDTLNVCVLLCCKWLSLAMKIAAVAEDLRADLSS